MHSFLRSCGKPLWWLALLCGAWTAAHSAEPVAEQDLKAAYIFNFSSAGKPGSACAWCMAGKKRATRPWMAR